MLGESKIRRRKWLRLSLSLFLLPGLLSALTQAPLEAHQSLQSGDPPQACQGARGLAGRLLGEFDSKISAADRSRARAAVEKAESRGWAQAEGFSQFAAGAMLQRQFALAVWGALQAAALEWNPRYMTNAGVYLIYIDRLADAEAFLKCAHALNSRSPYVVEAQAMLAYRRKDCATATRLIEEAVKLFPGDMNSLYNAGVINYRCGDRAKAKQHLRAAERENPGDKTVTQALKIVDPTGRPAVPPPRDALSKLTEECYRFMDKMLRQAELVSELANRIHEASRSDYPAYGPWKTQDYASDIRENVRGAKNHISSVEKKAGDTRFGSLSQIYERNYALYESAIAYSRTVYDFEQVYNEVAEISIMAAAMKMDPARLAQKLGDTGRTAMLHYLFLREDEKFREATKPYQTLDGEAYCAVAVPLWQSLRDAVHSNMRAAESGFPKATETYANYRLALVRQAISYNRRAIAAMKPHPSGQHIQYADLAKKSSLSSLGYTMRFVSDRISQMKSDLSEGIQLAPREVDSYAGGPPRGPFWACPQQPVKKLTLKMELEQLLAALKEASSFETEFKPECELTIGDFSSTVNFLGGGSPNLEYTPSQFSDSLSASAETDFDRWGADLTVSESDVWGPPLAPGVEVGLATEVGVSLWGEGKHGERADYGIDLYSNLGVGISALGGSSQIACYGIQTTARINARALAERLRGP